MSALKRREKFKYPYYLNGRYKDFIIELAENDEGLKDALVNEHEYTFSVDIMEVYKRFPVDEMKPSRYPGLIRYLRELGINIIMIPRIKKRKLEIINLIALDKNKEDE